MNALIADQTTLENRNVAFTLSFIMGGAGYALGTALPFFIPELVSLLGARRLPYTTVYSTCSAS